MSASSSSIYLPPEILLQISESVTDWVTFNALRQSNRMLYYHCSRTEYLKARFPLRWKLSVFISRFQSTISDKIRATTSTVDNTDSYDYLTYLLHYSGRNTFQRIDPALKHSTEGNLYDLLRRRNVLVRLLQLDLSPALVDVQVPRACRRSIHLLTHKFLSTGPLIPPTSQAAPISEPECFMEHEEPRNCTGSELLDMIAPTPGQSKFPCPTLLDQTLSAVFGHEAKGHLRDECRTGMRTIQLLSSCQTQIDRFLYSYQIRMARLQTGLDSRLKPKLRSKIGGILTLIRTFAVLFVVWFGERVRRITGRDLDTLVRLLEMIKVAVGYFNAFCNIRTNLNVTYHRTNHNCRTLRYSWIHACPSDIFEDNDDSNDDSDPEVDTDANETGLEDPVEGEAVGEMVAAEQEHEADEYDDDTEDHDERDLREPGDPEAYVVDDWYNN